MHKLNSPLINKLDVCLLIVNREQCSQAIGFRLDSSVTATAETTTTRVSVVDLVLRGDFIIICRASIVWSTTLTSSERVSMRIMNEHEQC